MKIDLNELLTKLESDPLYLDALKNADEAQKIKIESTTKNLLSLFVNAISTFSSSVLMGR
jgi:hypothetical protein